MWVWGGGTGDGAAAFGGMRGVRRGRVSRTGSGFRAGDRAGLLRRGGGRPGGGALATRGRLRALRGAGVPPRRLHRAARARRSPRHRAPRSDVGSGRPRALNPGERDRRRDLSLRGIAYQGSADSAEVLTPAPPPWQLVAELRARFTRRCAEVCTTPARAGLVAALGAGDRSLIPPEVE